MCVYVYMCACDSMCVDVCGVWVCMCVYVGVQMCELRSFASAKEWLSNCPMTRCIHVFSCVRLNTSCTRNIACVCVVLCV